MKKCICCNRTKKGSANYAVKLTNGGYRFATEEEHREFNRRANGSTMKVADGMMGPMGDSCYFKNLYGLTK